jgi:L-ribulose-5-phosphate 3-epimerase
MNPTSPSPTRPSRREFLTTAAVSAAAIGLGSSLCGGVMADDKKKPAFEISLAQWTINRELRSGKIDNLDFAKVAHDHGIFAIEYVNQFFMDKAKDKKYLGEMKNRAAEQGVKSLILMCDQEGNIGHPDAAQRAKTVENHRKWVDAAKTLGCHSIRVNAASAGSWDEQVKLAADGLSKLTEIGAAQDMNVIV